MSRGVVANHDALALALAFFEAPGRFPDLLHGRAPLPSGMTELLQVAAGDLREAILQKNSHSLGNCPRLSITWSTPASRASSPCLWASPRATR